MIDSQDSATGPLSASMFAPQEWDNGKFSIQHWLRKTAWHNLKDTEYGTRPDAPPPHAGVLEDPLLNQIYKIDVATFLAAERVSVQCVAGCVGFSPDETTQMHLATQTLDEARHYEVFSKRMAAIGVGPEERLRLIDSVTTPAMAKFFHLILEQVDKRDFLGATIALNLILEGMAYPVYRYEAKYWSRLDPALSQVISGAFADEITHVGFGEAYIRSAVRTGAEVRNKTIRLAKEFNLLMTEVFNGVIRHYVGLYQEAANNYLDLMGDLEIFPGHIIANTSEEQQVRILLNDIGMEFRKRMRNIGIEMT